MVVTPDIPFASIELVLMHVLEHFGETDTAVPDEAFDVGIQINRVGGDDDGTTDFPRVEISVYADEYVRAQTIGLQIQQYMLALGGEAFEVGSQRVTIDYCRTDTAPEGAFYDNPDRVRHVAWYRLGLMRPRLL